MAKYCEKCGKKLSFFSREKICKVCKKINEEEIILLKKQEDAEIEELKNEIILNKDSLEMIRNKLSNKDKIFLRRLYFTMYNYFAFDKELTAEEINLMERIKNEFGLSNEEIRYDELILPYIYLNSIRKGEKLPEIKLKVEGSAPPVLKKAEVINFADNSTLMELKTIKLGYVGGSHGISFRIMKGVTYKVGAHKGYIAKEDQYVTTSKGVLIITNQRLFLHPLPGYKPVSIPLNKILSYQCYCNGIEIYKEGREKAYFFSILKSSSVEIFGLCLSYYLTNN